MPNPVAQPPKKKPSLAELLTAAGQGRAAADPAAALGANPDDGDIRFANYELPEIDLLDTADLAGRVVADPAELQRVQTQIVDTLEQFGIRVSPGDITKGPTITRYEVYPAKGVRVDKIVSLERDLARATRAERINILAPIPGKDTVGIEIANSKKVKVTLRELLEGPDWAETTAKIPIALGKDVYGKTIIADLAAMPHCLVAGATGSGKSVCINSIISSILYRFTPEQLRFVMIDPKVVEMQIYNTAAAPRRARRHRPEEGAARPALGHRRDGETLQDVRQDRRAQHHQFQRPAQTQDPGRTRRRGRGARRARPPPPPPPPPRPSRPGSRSIPSSTARGDDDEDGDIDDPPISTHARPPRRATSATTTSSSPTGCRTSSSSWTSWPTSCRPPRPTWKAPSRASPRWRARRAST